jgi:hypothetical protein
LSTGPTLVTFTATASALVVALAITNLVNASVLMDTLATIVAVPSAQTTALDTVNVLLPKTFHQQITLITMPV